jgi:antitoxin PrlF
LHRHSLSCTVTVKGQVTIPKPIRDVFNIGPGSSVEFVVVAGGEIVLRKAGEQKSHVSRFDSVRGGLRSGDCPMSGMSTEEIMAFLRGDDSTE